MEIETSARNTPFLKELGSFIRQCEITLSSGKGKKTPPVICLGKFKRIYDKRGDDDENIFTEPFISVYNKHKKEVLSTVVNDEIKDKWLKEGIIFQLGEGIKRCSQTCILFSSIYRKASEARDKAEALLGQNDTDDEENFDLIRPSILLYHLFMMWKSIFPDEAKLNTIVDKLKEELGMDGDREAPTGDTGQTPFAIPQMTADMFKGDGFGKLFDVASTVMKKMNIDNTGPEGQSFDSEEFKSVFGGVFDSEVTQKVINGVAEKASKSTNVGDLLSAVTENLQIDELEKTIHKEVSKVKDRNEGGTLSADDDDTIVIIPEESKLKLGDGFDSLISPSSSSSSASSLSSASSSSSSSSSSVPAQITESDYDISSV